MLASLPRLLRVVPVAVLCVATASAFATSSRDFAAQVDAHRAEMARNGAVVAQTALLCGNLPSDRAMEEPKCVALHLHMRALAAKERHGSCGAGDSTITQVARCLLGGLAGSAA